MTNTALMNNELTCQEFVELVTEYLEDALTPMRRTQFEAHLEDCEGCVIYLEQMRQTIQLLGKLDESSVPTPGKKQLLQAFRNWKYQ